MLARCIWILLYILNVSWASSEHVVVGEARRLPAVESLISSLQQERWSEDQLCLRATLHWLTALRNRTLWAAWIWDSMQPPVGTLIGNSAHLGNFDQCLQFPWTSSHPDLQPQYCIVDVATHTRDDSQELDAFDDTEEFYQMPSKYGRYNNRHEVGVCLPAACGAAGAARVYRHMVRDTLLAASDVTVEPGDCYIAGDRKETSRKFYAFWSVIGILVMIAILSTIYVDRKFKKISLKENNKCQIGEKLSCLDIITGSFCIKRNYNDLLKVNKNDIQAMNGVRVLTAVTIAIVHDGLYSMQTPNVHSLVLDQMTASRFGGLLLQTSLQVDTFFTMSGLLLVRSLMMEDKNLIIVLVKRYFRLLGPFVITILYVATATMEMDSSPYWKRANRYEVEVCEKYWWKSLMMMNTHILTVCHPPTWYIASDYQLAILMIFIFYLYKKNRTAGVTAAALISTAMSLYLGFKIYQNKLPYLSFDQASTIRLREYTSLLYHYLSFYCHSGPYFVGAIMGYVMAKYNPRDYKNLLCKKWSTISLVVSMAIIGLLLSFGAVARDIHNPLLISVSVPISRILWAAGICGLIASCEYGLAPLMNNILSWSGFVPFSKLSYCMYLVHTFLLQIDKVPVRTLGFFTHYLMVRNGFGVVVISFMVSFVLYLTVEAPIIHISNYFLSGKSQEIKQSSSKVSENDPDITKMKPKQY